MIVVNTETIPGMKIVELKGLVQATPSVRSMWAGTSQLPSRTW